MTRKTRITLAVALLALLAAAYLTAHPCDIDGRHDPACVKGQS